MLGLPREWRTGGLHDCDVRSRRSASAESERRKRLAGVRVGTRVAGLGNPAGDRARLYPYAARSAPFQSGCAAALRICGLPSYRRAPRLLSGACRTRGCLGHGAVAVTLRRLAILRELELTPRYRLRKVEPPVAPEFQPKVDVSVNRATGDRRATIMQMDWLALKQAVSGRTAVPLHARRNKAG